jgi:hypothetical protein
MSFELTTHSAPPSRKPRSSRCHLHFLLQCAETASPRRPLRRKRARGQARRRRGAACGLFPFLGMAHLRSCSAFPWSASGSSCSSGSRKLRRSGFCANAPPRQPQGQLKIRRYSGASLGYQLGSVFGGALAPMIAVSLLVRFHGVGVSVYVAGVLPRLVGLGSTTQENLSNRATTRSRFGLRSRILAARVALMSRSSLRLEAQRTGRARGRIRDELATGVGVSSR